MQRDVELVKKGSWRQYIVPILLNGHYYFYNFNGRNIELM